MKRRRKMIVKGETGVAAIEMAIVLPLLVLLLIGIIEFSVLLYDKAMITNASREGARAGVVYGADGERLPYEGIKAVVETYAEANLITFGNPDTLVTETDPGDGSVGSTLTVTVRYQYNFLVLPAFLTGLSDLFDLEAVTAMRYE